MTEWVWVCGLIHASVCLRDSHVRGTGHMCVEQGKHTAAGEEAECACIRVCTRPREAATPRTLEPRCVCGEEYASRVVCVAMGAHQRARLEGTGDGVTGRQPARARARVCVCVCV